MRATTRPRKGAAQARVSTELAAAMRKFQTAFKQGFQLADELQRAAKDLDNWDIPTAMRIVAAHPEGLPLAILLLAAEISARARQAAVAPRRARKAEHWTREELLASRYAYELRKGTRQGWLKAAAREAGLSERTIRTRIAHNKKLSEPAR